MKNLFNGYYRPADADLRKAWKSCLFVLDANVLLNFYRYSPEVRSELVDLLTTLGDRAWVPYHAALEYQRNRLAVIAEQVARFKDAKSALTASRTSLFENFNKLQLRDRHSLIDPDAIISDIDEVVKKYQVELEILEQQQNDVHEDDPVRESIDKLFSEKIGPQPTADELKIICEEAKTRFLNRIPPGFMDERKADGPESIYSFGGLSYEARLGDLYIWKQIIARSKTTPGTFIIFITDDDKPDWWWIAESQGKKRLGARPELSEEIMRDGSASGFHIYNTNRFMEHAKEYLQAKVSDDSITEVKKIFSESIRMDLSQVLTKDARDESDPDYDRSLYLKNISSLVMQWVIEQNPLHSVILNRGWPDMVATSDGQAISYESIVVTTPSSIDRRLRFEMSRGSDAISRGQFSRHEVIAVGSNGDHCEALYSIVKSREFSIPNNITITIGNIVKDEFGLSKYKPIWRVSEIEGRKMG